MPLSEFDLISRYFSRCGAARADVVLGVGDDGAVLECPPGAQLVAAIDSLVEAVHFPQGSPARSIGHRALAVNLSDLAAMGAQPAWALLALALPAADEAWLKSFSEGLDAIARQHEVSLVGGDTTGGSLCVTVQVLGFVPRGTALTRSGAASGDAVFVSGTPVTRRRGCCSSRRGCRSRVRPRRSGCWTGSATPRRAWRWGRRLRGLASACIDVSDGLLGDCGRLAAASGCGVRLESAHLPVSAALRAAVGEERARELALTGGEDYELCFTVPRRDWPRSARCPACRMRLDRIGTLTSSRALSCSATGL